MACHRLKSLCLLLLFALLSRANAWSFSDVVEYTGLYSCKDKPLSYADVRKGLDSVICHQPRATHLVASHLISHFQYQNPMSPLSMVWQGGPGVGKSSMIDALSHMGFAEVISFQGATLSHADLVKRIEKAAKRCPRTIFVIDDADLAPAPAISELTRHLTGSMRSTVAHSVFIFVINVGLSSIEHFVSDNLPAYETTHFSKHPSFVAVGSPSHRNDHSYCFPSSNPAAEARRFNKTDPEYAEALTTDLSPDTFWLGRVAALSPSEQLSAASNEVKLRETVEFAVLHAAVRAKARSRREISGGNSDITALGDDHNAVQSGVTVDALASPPRQFFNKLVQNRVITAWVPFLPISASGARCCAAAAAWEIIDDLTRERVGGVKRLVQRYFSKKPEQSMRLCSVSVEGLHRLSYDIAEAAMGLGESPFVRGGCRSVKGFVQEKLWRVIDLSNVHDEDLKSRVKCIRVTAKYEGDEVVITHSTPQYYHDEL